jgi:hypothetical protein
MSAQKITSTHRNQQRRARAIAKAGELPYQEALQLVRSEEGASEGASARVPALTERRGWSTLIGDGEPKLKPLPFTAGEGRDEYAGHLNEELLAASTDGVLERRRLEHEVDRRLQALEIAAPDRLRSFQDRWLPGIGHVWEWDHTPTPLLISMLVDLMAAELFAPSEMFPPFEEAAPDPLEDLVEELLDASDGELIDEMSSRLQRLQASDPETALGFEREWALALRVIADGEEGLLADDELERMVAQLRLGAGDGATESGGAKSLFQADHKTLSLGPKPKALPSHRDPMYHGRSR